jgi:hypothetical protein
LKHLNSQATGVELLGLLYMLSTRRFPVHNGYTSRHVLIADTRFAPEDSGWFTFTPTIIWYVLLTSSKMIYV